MKKRVKEVFDIDQYTSKGQNKIFLISGVCSGKSSWVMEVLTQKGSVLFITSRKAKAEADISNSTFSDVIQWYSEGNQTLITNAGLAKRIENIMLNSKTDIDEFINHFDYIVVDEVHSIASDSIFAESCFTLLSFIEYVAEIGKPIVCMTGTPEPIQYYFEKNGWLILDFLDICNYVHPSQITMIHKHNVVELIKRNCTNNKIIYFANRTSSIKEFCRILLSQKIFDAPEISISVSKNREEEIFGELKKALNNNDAFNLIQKASKASYQHIISAKRLPDGCKILFSTSTLKEGVDIENENVVLFCENHMLSNLIQFFGRARKGNTKVFVIEDSTDHQIKHNEILYQYAVEAEVSAANYYYKTKIDLPTNPLITTDRIPLIQHISNNPYIYFDFLKNEFRVFHVKYLEEKRLLNNRFWKHDILQHCIKYNIDAFCFETKRFMKEALERMATQKEKYYREDKIILIQHMIYIAYGIEYKQPKKINDALKSQNEDIRIASGKGSKGNLRNITYWQVLFSSDCSKK